MKVVLIGASGFVGTPVLDELLNRGHQVTAIVRNPDKIAVKNDNLTIVAADIFDTENLAALIKGSNAVISAYNPGWTNPEIYNDFIKGSESIRQALKKAGVKRLLVVGGAGSLRINGAQLVDGPQFPAEYKAGATAARDYLNMLYNENDLDWTFLSPAIYLLPGERTAKFRLGTDEPVFDAAGKCEISVEDMAVAIVDEIENNHYIKKRFTLGY
ncbi:NAD(P)-dependent oxidoreductase [Mucilaginibacter sp.]|uniref:NAD(P)-dependent oxidoreductase n=1 Tax=Mucilaginibacter sp. TaxID=1882438 RepID=UPI00284D7A28|nr:NAD(P)-dependent oxidoreductase [Mucilaginibacter sp.]MDR3696513.1 NAD(P)-dependent oxidoreductase [Mucilaginibacter sp.]